jgi:hypothetical protein
MSQCVIDDTHQTYKHNMRPSTKNFIKYSFGLRVKDSFEYPHKSYCQNKLTLLYSYGNKSCVRAKYIVIKIEFML